MPINPEEVSENEVISILSRPLPGGRWSPAVGRETLDLLAYLNLSEESSATLSHEALAILGQCISPILPEGSTTGLVVGYVQSGKTMSFTTVAALAHDNGYPIVIVIAGTSKPLLNQSTERLTKDLRLNSREDRRWKPLLNPKLTDIQGITNTLTQWNNPETPDNAKQTVLITVMKQHTHLKNLSKLLATIDIDLKRVPVLIIDDEADQAGLNNAVRRGKESPTYARLLEIRRHLQHHSFLQYTATPQAPLLINIIDVLSPNFVQVLTPGDEYTGGKAFFKGSEPLNRPIPEIEIPSDENILSGAPRSLRLAMALFYLGVAAAYVEHDPPKGNRSMMVHPSQKTVPHAEYKSWVDSVQTMWVDVLKSGSQDPDYQSLLQEFKLAHDDLKKKVTDLPSLEILSNKLYRAVSGTRVIEINSKQPDGTPQIVWKSDYAHILIGGQAMDRGFTVEGLTVTYMPRGSGLGNADTIQQRARFYGYKKSYLGYCRVFVEDNVKNALVEYVDHEEDIRSRLSTFSQSMKPLSEWKRAFILDLSLKPTRPSVLALPIYREKYSNDWFYPKASHVNGEAVTWNQSVIQNFLSSLTFHPHSLDSRLTKAQQHEVSLNVPLSVVLTQLLLSLRIADSTDSQHFTGILLQIERYFKENSDTSCAIYNMSQYRDKRTLGIRGTLPALHQGANPSRGSEKGSIYPGDAEIYMPGQLTVQIHNLRLISYDKKHEYPNVSIIALWIPEIMAKGWLVEDQ